MRSIRVLAEAFFALATLAGCAGVVSTGGLVPEASFARTLRAPLGSTSIVATTGTRALALCAPSTDSARAACLGSVRMMGSAANLAKDVVAGLTPDDLAALYGYASPVAQRNFLPPTIGIVVAYDAPSAEADLAVYRARFGLPACTTANGCFTKISAAATSTASTQIGTQSTTAHPTVTQPGQNTMAPTEANPDSTTANPTSPNAGWNAETDGDLEAVSAVCPSCRIVLSEATSDDLAGLGSALQTAVAHGATIVNASFGAPEDPSQRALTSTFQPALVNVVASAGDTPGALLFPAVAPNVIAVAGTSLSVSGSQVTESLWPQSGGGCSAVFARPLRQPAWCATRSVADVAVVGDPATGLAFYDSTLGGWGVIGGTSISAPIVAGILGQSKTIFGNGNDQAYLHRALFAPVVNGGTISGLGIPTSPAAL